MHDDCSPVLLPVRGGLIHTQSGLDHLELADLNRHMREEGHGWSRQTQGEVMIGGMVHTDQRPELHLMHSASEMD